MKRKRFSITDLFNHETPFATEFRRLLYKVQSLDSESELKSLLISSAMLSEGKSTICSLLGITAALHKGLRTLVMDCDIRRPCIHKLFRLERGHGMAEILAEGFSPRDAIRKTDIDKLDVITCGSYHTSPTELFDAEAIGTLIEEMKFHYDLVLIDAAPALPVSDPMLLAPKVDGILLVVKAGATQREIVQRAVEILNGGRKMIVGVVLNNMNNTLPYYYDYRYYGYQYTRKSDRPGKDVRSREVRRQKKDSRTSTGEAPKKTGLSHS